MSNEKKQSIVAHIGQGLADKEAAIMLANAEFAKKALTCEFNDNVAPINRIKEAAEEVYIFKNLRQVPDLYNPFSSNTIKHRNGKYNKTTKNKKRAAKKARKQTRKNKK